MRGRQSVNPLNKLGFAVARQQTGAIQITKLGKKFLSEDYDIGTIFFKSMLKLQFPNPWITDFSAKEGFDVVPFVATMHLLDRLQHEEPVGLTCEEFCLFVPTLTNADKIDDQAARIKQYRQTKDKQTYSLRFMREFYEQSHLPQQKINNLRDYGDNAMRYFRLTRYFRVQLTPLGDDWRISLEPSRQSDIQQILALYDGHALRFNNPKEYLDYIIDLSQPVLPWETRDNILQIATDLRQRLQTFILQNLLY